ncbi:hypothetical protein BCR42DRAFT_437775 [Absidia repens]|uniref:Uncharacterized protein n=1 Tax=Absidia repens TaxID=90262 RepID=A0A1X2IHC1_9FUNG|nr:hypothetical protein BCR42DRAFT_437775 [Absidia repens]
MDDQVLKAFETGTRRHRRRQGKQGRRRRRRKRFGDEYRRSAAAPSTSSIKWKTALAAHDPMVVFRALDRRSRMHTSISVQSLSYCILREALDAWSYHPPPPRSKNVLMYTV